MKCRSTTVLLLMPVWLLVARSGAAQSPTDPLIDAGLQQLATARATRSEAALQQAEVMFAKALEQDPNNPRILAHDGIAVGGAQPGHPGA